MRVGTILKDGNRVIVVEKDGQWYDLSIPGNYLNLGEMLKGKGFSADKLDRLLGTTGYEAIDKPKSFEIPFFPGKIIAIGRNYAKHAAETGHDVPSEPMFFFKRPDACIGDGEPIVVEDWYGRVDHEGEIAVIIAKPGKNIQPEEAYDHIAGYSLMNDVTAREMQKADIAKGHPWFRSKNLDTFAPFGPMMTLKEAMPWPLEVDITVRVNGEARQQSNTRNFIFDIPTLIAHVSAFVTLEAGDVISTGTPEGISPLRPGDTVEVEAPGIGILTNPVQSG